MAFFSYFEICQNSTLQETIYKPKKQDQRKHENIPSVIVARKESKEKSHLLFSLVLQVFETGLGRKSQISTRRKGRLKPGKSMNLIESN